MRILLIDDDDLVRDTLCSFLESGGHDVVQAPGGEQGLALLEQETPDAIICDRIMPNVSGFEVLERVRRDWPHLSTVPFLFLSGLSDERDVAAVSSLAPTAYLSKPIKRADLLAALERAFTQPKAPT